MPGNARCQPKDISMLFYLIDVYSITFSENLQAIDVSLKHFRIFQNSYSKKHPRAATSVLYSSVKLNNLVTIQTNQSCLFYEEKVD